MREYDQGGNLFWRIWLTTLCRLFAATTRKGRVLVLYNAELTISICSDVNIGRMGETAIVVREYIQGGKLFLLVSLPDRFLAAATRKGTAVALYHAELTFATFSNPSRGYDC